MENLWPFGNFSTEFHSGWTCLHSHQQFSRIIVCNPKGKGTCFLNDCHSPLVLVVLIASPAVPPGLSPNYCFFIFYSFSFFYSPGSALCQRQTYVSIFLLRKLLEPKFSFIQQPVLTSFSGENNSHASVDVSIHLNCSQPEIPPGHTWHALVKVCKHKAHSDLPPWCFQASEDRKSLLPFMLRSWASYLVRIFAFRFILLISGDHL